MNPNENKPNFMDRGTITAIVVMLIFWFGWTKYMEQKYPAQPAVVAAPAAGAPGTAITTSSGAVAVPGTTATGASAVAGGPASSEETFTNFEDENLGFKVSSRGMGLRDIDVRKYKTRKEEPIILGGVPGDYPFSTNAVEGGQPLNFKVEQPTPGTFVGHAVLNGLEIEKTLKVDSANYATDTTINVTGNFDNFKGLSTSLSEVIQVPEASGILGNSSREYQEWYLRHDNTKTRKMITSKDALQLDQANVSIAALSTHYFSIALVDRSDLLPKFDSTVAAGSKLVSGRLVYAPISRPEKFTIHYVGYTGPKSFEILSRVDENLPQVVDYGIFGFLGKPILWLLKFLYSMVGNWGWAIIGLTIIIRAIVLPFNAYSFKSMKAMQRIQPEMARVRERYKDKPNEQKLEMNKEIMALMKANKASPVGGCLPTLLQLPPFFALYQVLGQSIELYRQPFIFWIHDLSARDPYFVLPVLMGATMFTQQRLTPTAMDPQQAKVMMWMPLIFSAFMLSLPSGLTLYIFVSTLFGIGQQYIFMKDKAALPSRVKEAKA